MEEEFPPHVSYWITQSSKNDCFFVVGLDPGPTERIGAFKIFLMAHSEPLANMLEDSDLAEEGDIYLTDIEPETFRNFLKCIYGGSDIVIKSLSFEESAKLLYVAEKYLVAEVKEKVVPHMLQLLPQTFHNTLVALVNLVCLQDKRLEKAISTIVHTNTEKIFADDLFLQLPSQALLWIVKQETLSVEEIEVWKAVLKWGKQKANTSCDVKSVRKQILQYLKFIRFFTMSCTDFIYKVIPDKILTAEEICVICESFSNSKVQYLEFICNSISPRYKPRVEILSQLPEPIIALRRRK